MVQWLRLTAITAEAGFNPGGENESTSHVWPSMQIKQHIQISQFLGSVLNWALTRNWKIHVIGKTCFPGLVSQFWWRSEIVLLKCFMILLVLCHVGWTVYHSNISLVIYWTNILILKSCDFTVWVLCSDLSSWQLTTGWQNNWEFTGFKTSLSRSPSWSSNGLVDLAVRTLKNTSTMVSKHQLFK